MKIIGITGPTGAGKTTALHALTQLGAEIIDADAVYHHLLAHSQNLQQTLIAEFGEIRDGEGNIDRKKLGGIVFSDEQALEHLNQITHTFVGEEVARRIAQAEAEGKIGVAIDAIALVESGMGQKCQAIVAVLAPSELRIRRIMAREGISEAYARQRVSAQKDGAFFRANSTHVLENQAEESRENFEKRAAQWFATII